MRFKFYFLLFLLAPLFLSSYKIDNSKNTFVKKSKPLFFEKIYNDQRQINITSTEVGYYSIPISANVKYYTDFGTTNRNMISSIEDFTDSYSLEFTTQEAHPTGGLTTVDYSLTCTINGPPFIVIDNSSDYAMAATHYLITVKKTFRSTPGHGEVIISRDFNEYFTYYVHPSFLPFEIEL